MRPARPRLPGSLGDKCELDSDCLNNNCIGEPGGFCSKACFTNQDCGVSPWGVPNACVTNQLGDDICFPGCKQDLDCTSNLDTSFGCFDDSDSGSMICEAF